MREDPAAVSGLIMQHGRVRRALEVTVDGVDVSTPWQELRARAERAEADARSLGQQADQWKDSALHAEAERDALRAALAALVEKLNNCTDNSEHCVEDDDLDEAEAVLAALSGPAPTEGERHA